MYAVVGRRDVPDTGRPLRRRTVLERRNVYVQQDAGYGLRLRLRLAVGGGDVRRGGSHYDYDKYNYDHYSHYDYDDVVHDSVDDDLVPWWWVFWCFVML